MRRFDFPKFAQPLREQIRNNAESLAAEHGIAVQFIRHHEQRKEAIVAKILEQRGDAPGLVAILSALELCPTFEPWHDKKTGRTFLPSCARQASSTGCSITRSRTSTTGKLPRCWQTSPRRAFCTRSWTSTRVAPAPRFASSSYQWNLAQVEYATDVVFRRQADLQPIYAALVRTAIHAVKPGQVATFLGRKHKLHDNETEEVGNNFPTRIQGTRIKHQIGPASVAFDAVVRLSETTEEAGRSYRGFNLFAAHDLNLFETVLRGENTIAGFRNADLRRHMPDKSTAQVSRMLCQVCPRTRPERDYPPRSRAFACG